MLLFYILWGAGYLVGAFDSWDLQDQPRTTFQHSGEHQVLGFRVKGLGFRGLGFRGLGV